MGTHLGAVLLINVPCWQVDLTGIVPELFAKAANLVHLNLGNTVAMLSRFKQSGVQWSRHLTFN